VAETLWRRLFRGSRHVRRRPPWDRLAGPGWEGRILDVPVTDNFHAKQGRSTGRLVLERDGLRLAVYLKRHLRLPWWRGLLALLRPGAGWSPALAEWDHLEWARGEGLPVPRPVAGGEFVGPGCRLRSFLAVEELTGMLPLHRAVPAAAAALAPRTFRRWKRGLAAEMAAVVRALHARRRCHQDLYLCHFFIAEADTRTLPAWPGRVWLIDLHRLAHHRWTWPWWRAKDLGQLLYSSDVAGVDDRDRLHFWRAYLGPRRRGLAARCLMGCARLRAWGNRRHNRKKQARATATRRPKAA
jgi:heptose I phosphotransferase